MKLRYLYILLVLCLGCSKRITKEALTDVSLIYDEKIVLFQNYYNKEEAYPFSEIKLKNMPVFISFKNNPFPYSKKSLFGFYDKECFSTSYPKVDNTFYEWLVNQETVNRCIVDSLNYIKKDMPWEGASKMKEEFKHSTQIYMLGKIKDNINYSSFLLLIEYYYSDELTFVRSDILRVNCKGGVITSLVQASNLIQEQTSFIINWTEVKNGIFEVKKHEGDLWCPFTDEVLLQMWHSKERFREEIRFGQYKIDCNGYIVPILPNTKNIQMAN